MFYKYSEIRNSLSYKYIPNNYNNNNKIKLMLDLIYVYVFDWMSINRKLTLWIGWT
jgi:hypothetical protein